MQEKREIGALSLGALYSRIWFLTVVGGLFNFFSRIEGNIFLPYLYSRVQCCGALGPLPKRYDISSPETVKGIEEEAASLGLQVSWPASGPPGGVIPACDLPKFPKGNKFWSLSATCSNKAYVQDVSQHNVAINTPLQKVMGLLVIPVGCTVSDAAGRRGVLMAQAICCLLACLLYVLDTRLHGQSAARDAMIYVAGMFLCATWEPKDAIINSAIADIVGHNQENKSRAMYMMQSIGTIGTVCGFVGAFVCLRRSLENYVAVWAIFAIIALGIVLSVCAVVPETLPSKLRQPLAWHMANPIYSYSQSMRLILRDRVLVLMAINDFLFGFSFVGFLSTVMSYLVMLGWRTSSAMGPGIMCTALEIIFAAAMVPIVPLIGVWTSATMGHALLAIGWLTWGPVTLLLWSACGPFLAATFTAAGFALYYPAKVTIVSQRVEEAHQGKCQAGLLTSCVLGVIVGAPLYANLLFDGTAQGMRRGVPSYVSLVLAVVCTIISTYTASIAPITKSALDIDLHSHPPPTQQKSNFQPPEGHSTANETLYGAA